MSKKSSHDLYQRYLAFKRLIQPELDAKRPKTPLDNIESSPSFRRRQQAIKERDATREHIWDD